MVTRVELIAAAAVFAVGAIVCLYTYLGNRTDARMDGHGIEDSNGNTVDFDAYRHRPVPKALHRRGWYESTNKIPDDENPDTAMIIANAREARRYSNTFPYTTIT